MLRRVFIFVNGILTFPGESKNWNARAVTFTHNHSGTPPGARTVAEKLEYWAGPIDRVFGQKSRAAKLADLLRAYAGWQINLIGHSNGADVIVDCLRDYGRASTPCAPGLPCIEYLHLVCAACEADFNRNGLNLALAQGRVVNITNYRGTKDYSLALAHSWPGKLLGYGTLGLSGPIDAAKCLDIRWDNYGHSTCWNNAHFPRTMAHFLHSEN
jgi:pimeloyl-ACP methyl ester carboxylesterase